MEKIVKKLVGDRWRDAYVRECLWEGCGKEFKAIITETKKGDGRFCSQGCAARYNNIRRKPHNLICKNCGDPFQSVMPQAKYCCHSCRRHQKCITSKKYNAHPGNHVYHFSGKSKKNKEGYPVWLKTVGQKAKGAVGRPNSYKLMI